LANQHSSHSIPNSKNQRWFRCLPLNTLALITLTFFCFYHNAAAETRYLNNDDGTSSDSHYQSPTDFSLSFSNTDLNLKSNNTIYPVAQDRVSVFMVTRITTTLDIGLILGSNFASLDNDPATAEFSLNGSHIGFSVQQIFGKDLQIGLYAYYIYQQATGENTLRKATLTWHEWLTEATLRLRLSNHWAIIAGGGFTGLDVDRRVKGDINETTAMNLNGSAQGRMAIELLTAPGDRIRLTLNRGAYEGLDLAFAHAF
jgi:hypothetical protein